MNIPNLIDSYKKLHLDKLQIPFVTFVFLSGCAINFKWFRFTDNIFPLKQYFHQNALTVVSQTLTFALSQLYSWIFTLIIIWIILVVMQTKIYALYSVRQQVGTINNYILIYFWEFLFFIKSTIFQNYLQPLPDVSTLTLFAKSMLHPEVFLFWFNASLAILSIIFAPFHYHNFIRSQNNKVLDKLIEDENSMTTSMPNMPSTFDNDI